MSHRRVLIIDDEEDIRDVAALALETAGDFEVRSANGGMAGIREAVTFQPDVILLDVMMPELDGPSTFRCLHQLGRTKAIPVIFLTAKLQANDRRKLAALGAAGLIAKPFDPLHLADELAAITGW